MGGLRWRLLLVGAAAFLLPGGISGSSHSLKYFYSGVSQPNQSLPQFFMVGYLDDQLVIHYDEYTKKHHAFSWLEILEKDPYSEPSFLDILFQESRFREHLKEMRNHDILSKELLTWQWMYSCENKNNSYQFWQFGIGHNGSSFFSFHTDNLTWVVTDLQAQVTERRQDIDHLWFIITKMFCFDLLHDYMEHKEFQLQLVRHRKPPVVTITSKTEPDGMETLTCHLNDFYPREINANWIKYGKPQKNYFGTPTFTQNGTFYAWLSITINPKDRHRYQCHVEHNRLKEPLDVVLNKPPVVTVSSEIEPDGMEILICHLEGFYPKKINAFWKKDGRIWHHDTVSGSVAPSLYGTYRQWLSIRIDPMERDLYRCHVEHEGLQESLDVAVNESSLMLILGCVIAVLVLVVAISGLSLHISKYPMATKQDQQVMER
ncbi:zinc-alpha-2-glycoprotein-like isoform 2-T2 [Liasis olivaceus]